MYLGDGRGHVPCKAEIESERGGNAPIIFDEGPVNLPAATSDGAAVDLVMDAQAGHSHQQVGFGAPRGAADASEGSEETDDPEAVLKSFGADVHLIGAKIDAGVNFMLAAD